MDGGNVTAKAKAVLDVTAADSNSNFRFFS